MNKYDNKPFSFQLRETMKKKGVTARQLCKDKDIDRAVFASYIDGLVEPSKKTVDEIMKHLNNLPDIAKATPNVKENGKEEYSVLEGQVYKCPESSETPIGEFEAK